MKLIVYFLLFSFPLIGLSQIGEGKMTKIFFDEFMEATEKWPVQTHKSDIFLNYNDGDYVISRRNSDKPYAVQPNFDDISRNFVIKTNIELAPTNGKDASMGVFIMLQQELKGGLIFEINQKGRFRLKQFLPNGFKYLSGDEKSEGWVKHDKIRLENKIEIKGYAGDYEFYVNDALATKTNIKTYQKGSFGLWVSPETMGKVDYFYTYKLEIADRPDILKDDLLAENEQLKAQIDSLKTENIKLRLSDGSEKQGAEEAIKVLEKRISYLTGENKALTAQLNEIKSDSEVGAVDLIEKMTQELAAANHANDSLNKVNRELLRKFDYLQERYYSLKDRSDSLLMVAKSLNELQEKGIELTKENISEETDKSNAPGNKTEIKNENTSLLDRRIPRKTEKAELSTR